VVWLSEAIGYLWDVFSKYLSIFKIRWLFPETQYVGHLTGIDKDTHELSASLASLEDLKQRSVYFGKSSADDLLAQVRDPLVGLPLDGRPNPGHLKENCKIFKAVFNNLVEIYMKDFQDKDGFLQHLGVHFPWEFAPPSFRIRSDKRGSTPKSAAEIVKLRIEMDDLRSDFKQAVADDGFTVEISDGDKISATGQSVEGTFDYLRAARGQASEHVFLRTVVVHDGDAPGSPPPTSAAEYNFPDVLYAAIDGAVKNKYQGIPGSIFAFSSGALQALGGQGEVQRRLDCALTEDQAPLKTGAKVFFCRTILYPKTRLARHATLKATR
jgi:hypothetical protein